MDEQDVKTATLGKITTKLWVSFAKEFKNNCHMYPLAGPEIAHGLKHKVVPLEAASHVKRKVMLPNGTFVEKMVPWDDQASREMAEENRERKLLSRKLDESRGKLWAAFMKVLDPEILNLIESKDKAAFEIAQRKCLPHSLYKLIEKTCGSLNEGRVKEIQVQVDSCYQNREPYDSWNLKLDDLMTNLHNAGRPLTSADKVMYFRDLINENLMRASHATIFSLDKDSPDLPDYERLRATVLTTATVLQTKKNAEKLNNPHGREKDSADKTKDQPGAVVSHKRKADDENEPAKQVAVMSVKAVKAVLKQAGMEVSEEQSQRLGNAIQNHRGRNNGGGGGGNTQQQVTDDKDRDAADRPRFNLVCYNCDKLGHAFFKCRGTQVKCDQCGELGHMAKHHDECIKRMEAYAANKGKGPNKRADAMRVTQDVSDLEEQAHLDWESQGGHSHDDRETLGDYVSTDRGAYSLQPDKAGLETARAVADAMHAAQALADEIEFGLAQFEPDFNASVAATVCSDGVTITSADVMSVDASEAGPNTQPDLEPIPQDAAPVNDPAETVVSQDPPGDSEGDSPLNTHEVRAAEASRQAAERELEEDSDYEDGEVAEDNSSEDSEVVYNTRSKVKSPNMPTRESSAQNSSRSTPTKTGKSSAQSSAHSTPRPTSGQSTPAGAIRKKAKTGLPTPQHVKDLFTRVSTLTGRNTAMSTWPEATHPVVSNYGDDDSEEREFFSMKGFTLNEQTIVQCMQIHLLEAMEKLVCLMELMDKHNGPTMTQVYRQSKTSVRTFNRDRMGDHSKPSRRNNDEAAFEQQLVANHNGLVEEMADLRARAERFDHLFGSVKSQRLFVEMTGMLCPMVPVALRHDSTDGGRYCDSPVSQPDDLNTEAGRKRARNRASRDRAKAKKAAEAQAAADRAAEAARLFPPELIPGEHATFTASMAKSSQVHLNRVDNADRYRKRVNAYKSWCDVMDVEFTEPEDCRKPSGDMPVSNTTRGASNGKSSAKAGAAAKTTATIDLSNSSPDGSKSGAKAGQVFKPVAVRPVIRATSPTISSASGISSQARSYAAVTSSNGSDLAVAARKNPRHGGSSPSPSPLRTLDISGSRKAVAAEVTAGSRRSGTQGQSSSRNTSPQTGGKSKSRQHDDMSRAERPRLSGFTGTIDQRQAQADERDKVKGPKVIKRNLNALQDSDIVSTAASPLKKRLKDDDQQAKPGAQRQVASRAAPARPAQPKPAPPVEAHVLFTYVSEREMNHVGLEISAMGLPGSNGVYYTCDNTKGTPLSDDGNLLGRIDKAAGQINNNDQRLRVLRCTTGKIQRGLKEGIQLYPKEYTAEMRVFAVRTFIDVNGDEWIILDSGAAVHVTRRNDMWVLYKATDRELTLISASGGKIRSEEVGWVKGMGVVVIASKAEQDLLSIYQLCKANPYVKISFAGAYATITHPLLPVTLWAKAGAEDQFMLRQRDFMLLQSAMGERLSEKQVRQFNLDNPEPDRQPTVTPVATRNIVSPDIGAMSLQAVPDAPAAPPAGTLQTASGLTEPILSKEQRYRAAQVRTLHDYLGHPSDDVLIDSLNAGVIVGTALTSTDVRNCRAAFGECIACKVGKTATEPHYTSLNVPTSQVGERIYMDIIPLGDLKKDGEDLRNASEKELVDQLGGYKYLLLCVDSYSNFVIAARINGKKIPENIMQAFTAIQAEFTRYKHEITKVIFDSEATLLACNTPLGELEVIVGATQPYLHNRRVERQVQTIKQRIRALRAGSQVVFPDTLQGELWQNAIYSLNDVLNAKFPSQTPRMLFEGTKTDLTKRSLIPAGTVVTVPQPENPEQRAAIGVCLRPSALTYGSNLYYMMDTDRIRVARDVEILKYIPDSFAWKVKSNKEQYTTQNKHRKRKKKTRKNTPTDGPVTQAVRKQRKTMASKTPQETNDTPPTVIPSREGDDVPELEGESDDEVEPDTSQDTHYTGTEGAAYIEPQHKRPGIKWTIESAMQVAIQGNLARQTQAALKTLQIQTETLTNLQNTVMTEAAISKADIDAIREAVEAEQVQEGATETAPTHAAKSKPPLAPGVKASNKPKKPKVPVVERTRSERIAAKQERQVRILMLKHDNAKVRKVCKIFRISVRESLKGDRAQESKEAILSEIQNMLQYRVGHYVRRVDIPRDKLKNILQSFMFVKHKTLPDGSYDKTKARMVGNGATQAAHMYDMVSSSTVALASVFLLVNIASYFKTKVTTYDIKGAFLHASFGPEDEVTYIRINKEITTLWIEQDPSAAPFVDDNGTLLLELDKFIYGLKQSPLKFQQHLTEVLFALGYAKTTQDDCVYVKHEGEAFSILSTHVDDIMQVATSESLYQELKDGLLAAYGDITTSDEGSAYLGMSIERAPDRRRIKLSQKGLVDKILKAYPREKGDLQKYYSPSSDDLFDVSGDKTAVPVAEPKRREFLSALMSLMYCARLTRPDILMPVTFLAGRAHCATDKDWDHLMRVVRYLENEPDLGVYINCDSLQIKCKCDASYVTHSPANAAYGHTGYIISLGENASYVHGRSGKQKLASTASTDAEIIAMCEALKTCMWLRELVRELHITDLREVVVYQDNQSAITLSTTQTTPKRSKHMLPKLTYVRSLELSRAVRLEYLSTTEMTADVLSKPLHGEIYYQHVDNMMGLRWSDKQVMHKMGSKRRSHADPTEQTDKELGPKKPRHK